MIHSDALIRSSTPVPAPVKSKLGTNPKKPELSDRLCV